MYILNINYHFVHQLVHHLSEPAKKTIELQRLIRTSRVIVVRAGRLELPRKLPFSGF